MGLFAATSGCTLEAGDEVAIANSEKAAVWVSIVSDDGPFGASAIIYNDDTCTTGSELAHLHAPACQLSPQLGPFISTCALYVGNIEGGSVNVWVRDVSR